MRKTLLFLITILLLEASTFAQDCDYSGTTGPLQWCLKNGTLTISGTGALPNYPSPISSPWYNFRNSIYTIVIENGVTIIGAWAFNDCRNLISVTIPNSVTAFGASVFRDCSSLITVSMSNNVTIIGGDAFYNCSSLSSVTIGNCVTTIYDNAFAACSNLTSITIPNSVTTLGGGAFNNCSSLTSVTMSKSVTIINGGTFGGCSSLTSINIPENLTIIGAGAFGGCSSLTSVTIPENLTTIYDGAFDGCSSLTTLTIPARVTTIGRNAFAGCSSLKTVNFNAINCTVGQPVFEGCTVFTTLNIGEGVKIIPSSTFYNCSSLTTVTIPASVTAIGWDAFSGCSNLTSITIPENVTNIRSNAFKNCIGLTSLIVCATTPPVVESFAFFNVTRTIPVYINCNYLSNYKSTLEWSSFTNYQCSENDEVSLHWDYSYAQPNIQPKGIAADGVARLIVKIKDSQNNIQSVSASLSASTLNNHTASMLGKLYPVTNQYSDEANNATDIFVVNVPPKPNGEVWLWYVAPDDFCNELNMNDYNTQAKRYVNINVEIFHKDDTKTTETVLVEVVRPPLMLAHGLNSDSSCWKNFHYDVAKFIESPLYPYQNQVKAITLHPDVTFEKNANILLSIDKNYWNSSFYENVNNLRKQGIAAIQVDYVCHSMGGCVLRKAIENNDWYYSGYTYRKGFVHKAITINTPHNGSPWGDFVTEAGPVVAGTLWNSILISPALTYVIFDFAKNMLLPNGQPSDAVRNLQIGKNGVKFATTHVKNHNIAGDINMDNLTVNPLEINYMTKYSRFTWSEIMRRTSNVEIKNVLNLNPNPLQFLNWYFKQKGVTNFFGDGDGVVSLSSQLAQKESLHNNESYNTIFEGWSAMHTTIVDRLDVGQSVEDLLNKDVNSNYFSNSISPNVNSVHKSSDEIDWGLTKSVVKVFDNSRIEIISPNNNSDFSVNDSLYLTFQIKDTNNLMFVDYLFQDNYGISLDKSEMQTVGFKVSPDFLDRQTIYVIANYDMGNTTMCYIDTISLNVVTNETLTDFKIDPKTANIYTTQYYYPQMQATYETFVSNVPCHSNKLTINVANTSIVQYDQNYYCFVGKNEGNTFAVIGYENLQDTIYFNVMLLPDTIPVGIKEFESQRLSSNILNINAYPNPTNNTINISFDYSIKGTMVLFDIFGKAVLSKDVSSDKTMIDIGNLSNGVYILQVVTNDKIMGSKKIIKQ